MVILPSYLLATSTHARLKVYFFRSLLTVDFIDLGWLCFLEHDTAAESVGTNAFHDLLSFDTSFENKLEGLRGSMYFIDYMCIRCKSCDDMVEMSNKW
jgi:hypothetical protein